MASNYKHQAFLFVPAASKPSADAMARQLNPEPMPDAAESFLIPLSASGVAPATHYACGVLLSDNGKTSVEANKAAMSGVSYYESDGWTFETALADIGLVRI